MPSQCDGATAAIRFSETIRRTRYRVLGSVTVPVVLYYPTGTPLRRAAIARSHWVRRIVDTAGELS
jgi:hypothetical protein